ncbi:anthranilate phosphoribosyltransferase [Clostridium sp. DL1XJH146]
MIKDAMEKLLKKENLTIDEMMMSMDEIMNGEISDIVISSFLTALKIKGETIEEITGGAMSLRGKMDKIELDNCKTIDTCGTGGDKSGTFNISTASAFICAAAGCMVVKHGNRSVSSKSGSADVLEKLGVKIDLKKDEVKECIENEKIGFLFAPVFHKAMKNVVKTRKELGYRTIFNILGPLANPAEADFQVLGVFDPKLTDIMANVLNNLGVKRALVVYGMDGIDEISLSDETKITELNQGNIRTYFVKPEDFGLNRCNKDELEGGYAEENAEIIKRLLKGEKGPKRDILLLNSGAALYAYGKVNSIRDGIDMARHIIDGGKAFEKLESFAEYTRRF